jgi:hypothetical protein
MTAQTIRLGKHTQGGGLGYTWKQAGDILDVPIADARKLITAAHGDIYEVFEDVKAEVQEVEAKVDPPPAPKSKPQPKPAPQPVDDLTDALAVSSVTSLKKAD